MGKKKKKVEEESEEYDFDEEDWERDWTSVILLGVNSMAKKGEKKKGKK